MTEKMKTTAPVLSVGADRAQPQLKNHNEIIANAPAFSASVDRAGHAA